jgi:hypothetical protein
MKMVVRRNGKHSGRTSLDNQLDHSSYDPGPAVRVERPAGTSPMSRARYHALAAAGPDTSTYIPRR